MMIRKMKRLTGILLLMAALMTVPMSASAKIQVNKSALTLSVGKNYRLKLNGLTGTEGNIVWKSKDKTVAGVTKAGTVVPKGKGTTCVYAVLDGKRYRCYVTVTQPVTSIALNKSSKTMQRGKTFQLKATLGPEDAENQELIWKSYNKKVATVDDSGKVTAVGTGTAKIVARARGGKNVRAICKVTVKAGTVKFNKTEMNLTVGQSAVLKVSPGGEGSVYAWASSDKTVVAVSNGKLTALKASSKKVAIVALRQEDGQKATCYVTVTGPAEETKETESSAEQPEETTGKAASAKAREFLALLEKYSSQVREDKKNGITWSYPLGNETIYKTWKQNYDNSRKTKNGYASCVQPAQWGLRDLGIIGNGNFRGDVGGGFTIGDKEQLLKHCEIIPVNKTIGQLIEEGTLLPGDICSYVTFRHTNVYAGDGKWYDTGRGGDGAYVDGRFVFNSFGPMTRDSSTLVGTIVRIIK